MSMQAQSHDYREAIFHAQRLTPEEQAQLVAEIANMLSKRIVAPPSTQQQIPRKRHNIRELKGLGKEIWEDVDVDEYIRQERASWDG